LEKLYEKNPDITFESKSENPKIILLFYKDQYGDCFHYYLDVNNKTRRYISIDNPNIKEISEYREDFKYVFMIETNSGDRFLCLTNSKDKPALFNTEQEAQEKINIFPFLNMSKVSVVDFIDINEKDPEIII
jgi:hypothetical protein